MIAVLYIYLAGCITFIALHQSQTGPIGTGKFLFTQKKISGPAKFFLRKLDAGPIFLRNMHFI